MTYVASVTDDMVFTAIRAWVIASAAVSDCIQGDGNRASIPAGGTDFVIMTPLTRSRLSLNETSHPTTSTETSTSSFDYAIQLDCYGPNAGDIVSVLDTSWYSNRTFDALKTQYVFPLYSEHPRFAPMVNGEQQYENRWILVIHIQFKPSITDSQQSASSVTITPTGIINVDVKYPG
ncbi:MAG: hypothetical protein ABFD89_09870 [Bryobacteraceae bacterium]